MPRMLDSTMAPLALFLAAACVMVVGQAGRAAALEIIGHRGASHDAPENTLAAFRLAFERGADGVEGDFYLSADGHVVCIHDARTKRTSDADLSVAGSTLAELRQLDAGSWKHPRYAGEPVPTLAEVLEALPRGKRLFIEVKCGPEIVPMLRRDIEASGVSRRQLAIIAFDAEVIAASRKAMPQIKAHWLTGWKKPAGRTHYTPSPEKVLETLGRIHASGLDAQANAEVMTPELVGRLRDAGFEVHCWTVNDPKLARQMIRAGVQSITTDRPGWLGGQLDAAR